MSFGSFDDPSVEEESIPFGREERLSRLVRKDIGLRFSRTRQIGRVTHDEIRSLTTRELGGCRSDGLVHLIAIGGSEDLEALPKRRSEDLLCVSAGDRH